MYEQVFKLHIRPFTTTPYVKHYFAAQSIHKALSQCQICVERGSGPVVVVGNLGTGKSLLLNLLAEHFRDRFHVVNLSCSRLEKRHELLQSMLFNLNQPYRDMSEVELRLALIDYLKPGGECPDGILMLVDEAHRLSYELLDELRLITNIVYESQPRVRMVMAGGCQFEENLTNPKLESFNQRIAARCFLANLVRDETTAYVMDHIFRAGGDGQEIFSSCALDCIHETSGGCPRVINQLCDHAMLLAAGAKLVRIDRSLVREAWADIQCIPDASLPGSLVSDVSAPQNEPNSDSSTIEETADSGSTIEFGELNDEPFETEELGESVNDQGDLWSTQQQDNKPVTMEFPAVAEGSDQLADDGTFVDSDDSNANDCLELAPLEPHLDSSGPLSVDLPEENELAVHTAENNPTDANRNEDCDLNSQENSMDVIETPYVDSLVDEKFADDPFALNVAEQNIKSLEVTQDHMRLLEDFCESRMDPAPGSNPNSDQHGIPAIEETTENLMEFQQAKPVETRQDQPFHVFQGLSEEALGETHSTNDCDATPPAEGQPIDELRLTDHELHELDLVANAVERLERDQSETTPIPDDTKCEEPAERPESALPSCHPAPNLSNTDSVKAECPDLNALSEAERLLEQIRWFTERDQGTEQEHASCVETTDAAALESNDVANIEHAVTKNRDHHDHAENNSMGDDRDMLVVSRSEQLNINAAEVDAEVSHANESPSTGHAIRMDYHKLFEQLRDA